ncbi:hypothetical protein IEO21_09238 [Rhodonia placenta]|uniref:Mitochondrial F1F0-ATP synthase g subunit n=1 Tax=Rhodonia placenta TaxID=104341 RepID=A0A8H7TYM7_9APHY|nr:hypothetical protein IEO21_09238 [Postia placenta]
MRASVSHRLSQSLRVRRVPGQQQQRFASSTPGGGFNSAEAQKKAQDALVATQKRLGEAVEVGKKVLGPYGEKAASMLGSYRQPLTYNWSVAREFLKQVYVAERLQPPASTTAITNAYSALWSRARNPAYWRELVRSGEWAKVGVYAVEAYGIFKIGEIIGRRSLVGYKVE